MNLTYEQAFDKLEKIVEQLQDEKTSLDDAITLFKQGVELQKYCQELLDQAQEKVALVIDKQGNAQEFIHEKDE